MGLIPPNRIGLLRGRVRRLLPLVALAVALREAGHEVVALGDEAGAPLAERYEIEFHALEGSLEDEMQPGGSLALAIDAGRFSGTAVNFMEVRKFESAEN